MPLLCRGRQSDPPPAASPPDYKCVIQCYRGDGRAQSSACPLDALGQRLLRDAPSEQHDEWRHETETGQKNRPADRRHIGADANYTCRENPDCANCRFRASKWHECHSNVARRTDAVPNCIVCGSGPGRPAAHENSFQERTCGEEVERKEMASEPRSQPSKSVPGQSRSSDRAPQPRTSNAASAIPIETLVHSHCRSAPRSDCTNLERLDR